MEPIVIVDEFVGDATVVDGQLPCDRIPFDDRLLTTVVAAAEGVVLGPVEEGFVQVVGPDPVSGIFLLPDQGATRAGGASWSGAFRQGDVQFED